MFFSFEFFISKFCVRIFISNFSISESFASTFLAPKFFLVQKFCTTTFLFKIYGSQNILVQTLMYSNFCLQIFCFFNFFILHFLWKHLSPISLSQNLLLGLFWLPIFFLYKNFAPRLFSPKFVDLKIFLPKLLQKLSV